MIEKALVSRLVGATSAGDRITPLSLERTPVLPALTYQRVSTPRDVSHDGAQGYAGYRVQIVCYAKRTNDGAGYRLAKQLADEVRLALDGWRGTAAGVTVGMCQIANDRDEQDPERSFEAVRLDAVGNYMEATNV